MDIVEGTENEIQPASQTEADVTPVPIPSCNTKREGLDELPNEEAHYENNLGKKPLCDSVLGGEANIIMDMKMGNQNSLLPVPRPEVNITPDPSWGSNRPRLSYSQMIAEALNQAENRTMPLSDIYVYISQRYPFYKIDVNGWQNSIRHNLSVNPSFYRVPRPKNSIGRGNFWTTNIIQNSVIQKRKVWPTRKRNAAVGQKPYPCLICTSSFKSSDEVQGHLQRRHCYMENVYLCQLCHLTFPNRSLWYSHYSKCPR